MVRSTTAYLLAPAPLTDGVAYLTVPRKFGGPAVMARISGDRLLVQRTSGVRTLFDYGCEVAAECNAVRAPVGDGLDVVYGVPIEEGGGYVARAGVNGRSLLVAGDETASGAVLSYTAAGGMSVYASRGTDRGPHRRRGARHARAGLGQRRRRARRGRHRRPAWRGSRAPGSRGLWYVAREGGRRAGDERHRPAARRAPRRSGAGRRRHRGLLPARAAAGRQGAVRDRHDPARACRSA